VRGVTSYGLQRDYVSAGNQRGTSNSDPFSAGLEASQPLYDGGRTENSVRARLADVSAARARLTDLEQQVLLQVIEAYLDILRDGENVSLAQNNVRVIAEQLRASEDRFEVGEVTRTDVSQARARLAEAEGNLALARGNLEQSRQAYRSVVGAEPQNLQPIGRLPNLPRSLDDALAQALRNHPAMVAARFDDGAASSDVKAAMGALLPSVSLDADATFNDGGVFDNNSIRRNSAGVAVRAVVPLYQAGVEYSRIRQAQAQASAARAGIQTEARTRQQEVERAWTALGVARANIVSQRQRVAAAQLAFEGVREEALVGSRTTLDVLDAEQELLDARVRLVDAVRAENAAAYGLLASTGELTISGLGIDAATYDPTISFERNNARFAGFDRTEDTVWEEFWRP
jgi:outer membrane protein